ncbi:MAG TPA: hypothetical protein VLK82_24335 [Candidatus Tectomicrobia bacterium]|nr:hypothetical protein [Candidatus Tectomicrobia bacterium]
MAIESAEETAVGKRWVEETFKRLAGEFKITMAGFKWRDDFPGPYISTLLFTVGPSNQPEAIEFRMRQLEDCRNPSNRPVRVALEQQVRDALQGLRQRVG